MEEWKSVIDYDGYYEVSNLGRVRSVEREIVRNDGVVQTRHSRIKKQTINHDGYCCVSLSKDGNSRKLFVHKLVYEAFIGRIPDGYEVNHRDFVRDNNCLDNLELLTHKDNVRYTIAAGRHYTTSNDMSGENNPNYGNHKLSTIYANDSDLSKEKQGRPGLQNGRCQRIRANYPNGEVQEYGCVKHCAEDIVRRGYSNATPASIYTSIWAVMQSGKQYKGIRFTYI